MAKRQDFTHSAVRIPDAILPHMAGRMAPLPNLDKADMDERHKSGTATGQTPMLGKSSERNAEYIDKTGNPCTEDEWRVREQEASQLPTNCLTGYTPTMGT